MMNDDHYYEDDDCNALDKLIKYNKWDDVFERLNTQVGKTEVRTLEVLFAGSYKSGYIERRLIPLLHFACTRNNVPYNVIDAMINAYPQSVYQKDYLNNLPIHIAALYSRNVQIIQLLITKHPSSLQQHGSDNKLPIHMAMDVSNCEQKHIDIIQEIVQRYPNGLRKSDAWGDLPIHIALQKHEQPLAILDIIKLFIRLYPEALHQRNNCHQLPIHVMCTRMLRSHQNSLRKTTKKGPPKRQGLNDGLIL